jgi:hypothetical protein
MTGRRLIEWNELNLEVRAERLERLAAQKIAESGAPIRDLSMRFYDSLLEVHGKLRRGISVPFRVEIRRIEVEGREVVVFIDSISAAGLPVPTLLGRLVEQTVAGGIVRIDGSGPTVHIRLDRILPSSVDVQIESIRITGEGLLVKLGRGGADPPEGAI